jgi:hypothetical protein
MKVKCRVFKFEVRLWSGFNNENLPGRSSLEENEEVGL